jgi:hypothetical protein
MTGLSVYLDIYRFAVPVVGIIILYFRFRQGRRAPRGSQTEFQT